MKLAIYLALLLLPWITFTVVIFGFGDPVKRSAWLNSEPFPGAIGLLQMLLFAVGVVLVVLVLGGRFYLTGHA